MRIFEERFTNQTQVPFASEVAPGVVKLKRDAGYVISFELEGVDFETCGDQNIDRYNRIWTQAVGALDVGSAVWVHRIKTKEIEKFRPPLEGLAGEIYDRYTSKLYKTPFNVTRLFVSIIIPPAGFAGKKRSFDDLVKHEHKCINKALETKARIESSLSAFNPVFLGHYSKGHRKYSRALEFYSFLLNGEWEEVPTPKAPVADVISSARITAAERSGVIELQRATSKTYASCFEIREYSHEPITPLQLADLFYSDIEFIETQSFVTLSQAESKERLIRQRSHMISGGQASETEIYELDALIDRVKAGRELIGEYHYNLSVLSRSAARVTDDRSIAIASLSAAQFKAVLQTTLPEAGWYHQLPGNLVMRTRIANFTAENFTSLAPLHGFLHGKKEGNPWGPALGIFRGASGQAYYFNFHNTAPGANTEGKAYPGNAAIFGKTGSGKTTLECFLIALLLAPKARVVVFDYKRSTEIALRSLGGQYKTFKRGIRTGINIFQWADTPAHRAFCAKVVALIYTRGGEIPITSDEENKLIDAVNTVFLLPKEQRRLAYVVQNLPPAGEHSMTEKLRRWVGTGDLAWLLDSPNNDLEFSSASMIGFDYTEFIDDPLLSSVFVSVMLESVNRMKDGRRLAIVLEECWKPMKTKALEDFAKNTLKTIRHDSGLVILTTQQPDDLLEIPLAKTAVQQCETLIALPNPNAYWEDYQQYGLTFDEFTIVKEMPPEARAFLVKQGGPSGKSTVLKFDLGGLDDVISILSGNTDSLVKLDAIREKVGDKPEDFLPVFLKEMGHGVD